MILAHGFTQNARCWGPFADNLAADHQVVAVDLPGHGKTAPEHDEADLVAAGRLLVETGGDGIYVGYSMGGRIALHGALARPESVRGLVLIGATAGIDEATARRSRREADDALAVRLTDEGLPRFLDGWLANPLFAGLSASSACVEQRLENRVDGLCASLRNCGAGNQEPLWAELSRLSMPVLILVGDNDAKFTELGRRLVAELPQASMRSLPGTHAVHLEQPIGAAAAVRDFFAQSGL